MRISINTDVLEKENLSLGEFLVMLMGYYDTDYGKHYDRLVSEGLVEPNLFSRMSVVLSNNSKDLVARILTESSEKLEGSPVKDFNALARKLQELYPEGVKPGTTYQWRGSREEIAQKLRVLVTEYGFTYTEQEAISAVKEYVDSWKDYKYMQPLKNFILKTRSDGFGHKEIDSLFMSIIENNR